MSAHPTNKTSFQVSDASNTRIEALAMRVVQELDRLVREEPISIIIAGVFLTSQLCLGLMSLGFLKSAEVIAFFYAVNLIMAVQALDSCYRLRLGKRPPLPVAAPRSVRAPPKEEEQEGGRSSSNMFIDRWRKEHEERPQFPLERLAYLNAVHHVCNSKHFFFLRNSQIKMLARKDVRYKRAAVDECHPVKMITDMFAAYVHRRALFYRSRNVVDANTRQFTQVASRPEGVLDGRDQYQYSLLYARENARRLRDLAQAFDDQFETREQVEVEAESSSSKKGHEQSFLSRVSQGMASAASAVRMSLKPKKNHHHHHSRHHHRHRKHHSSSSGKIECSRRYSRKPKS